LALKKAVWSRKLNPKLKLLPLPSEAMAALNAVKLKEGWSKMRFASQKDYEDYVKKYGADAAAGGNKPRSPLKDSAPQPTVSRASYKDLQQQYKEDRDAAREAYKGARAYAKELPAAERNKVRQSALEEYKAATQKVADERRATGDAYRASRAKTSPVMRPPGIPEQSPVIQRGMKKGGAVKESAMMKKEGRGMAKANMQKIADKSVKGHEKRMHGMKSGGSVSKRADGIAQRGKTRGKMC
jgi:hypothetical protein